MKLRVESAKPDGRRKSNRELYGNYKTNPSLQCYESFTKRHLGELDRSHICVIWGGPAKAIVAPHVLSGFETLHLLDLEAGKCLALIDSLRHFKNSDHNISSFRHPLCFLPLFTYLPSKKIPRSNPMSVTTMKSLPFTHTHNHRHVSLTLLLINI